MAELGAYEAPIYGILDVDKRIATHNWGAIEPPAIRFHGQPEDEKQTNDIVGRRMGDHLCDLPRYGCCLRGSHYRNLHSGGRAIRQL
jgi:hypothetical protein